MTQLNLDIKEVSKSLSEPGSITRGPRLISGLFWKNKVFMQPRGPEIVRLHTIDYTLITAYSGSLMQLGTKSQQMCQTKEQEGTRSPANRAWGQKNAVTWRVWVLMFKTEKQQGKITQQGSGLGSYSKLRNPLRMVVAVEKGHQAIPVWHISTCITPLFSNWLSQQPSLMHSIISPLYKTDS